jgi:hypothetical protein
MSLQQCIDQCMAETAVPHAQVKYQNCCQRTFCMAPSARVMPLIFVMLTAVLPSDVCALPALAAELEPVLASK